MICPKCDEGKIERVQFKKNGKIGYLCKFCATLWLAGETISVFSGHDLQGFVHDDMEFTFDELNEKDQDHQAVRFTNYK